MGVAFALTEVFLYPHGDPCPIHVMGYENRYPKMKIDQGGERTKMPLDPLFAVDLTNWGGEKPPMSIEAVVHAEDADNREYDSVSTLLSKPRKAWFAQR